MRLSLFTVAFIGVLPRLALAQASTYPTVGNVFFIPEENHDYSTIIGSSCCPFINNTLAAGGARLDRFYANTHPSIGNYEKAFNGVIATNDDGQTPLTLPISADNLVRHLNSAGASWKDYEEDIPYDGYIGGDTGNFATRHDVMPYYTDVQNDPNKAQKILVLSDHFAADLAAYDFAKFNYIGPNSQHEMHDGTPAQADTWLANNIGPLIASTQFKANGLLVLWWDEDGSGDYTCPPGVSASGKDKCGGHSPMIIYGPAFVRAGFHATTYYMQQSIERLLFGVLGLGLTGIPGGGGTVCTPISSVNCTPEMTEIFLPTCGNGVLDQGETCDPAIQTGPGACPTTCDDTNTCTGDVLSGSADTCDAHCIHTAVTACVSGDGCCPASCTHASDSDCVANCGNGSCEPALGESCSTCGADCKPAAGELCCNGVIVTGTCCVGGDCANGEACVNNTCEANGSCADPSDPACAGAPSGGGATSGGCGCGPTGTGRGLPAVVVLWAVLLFALRRRFWPAPAEPIAHSGR